MIGIGAHFKVNKKLNIIVDYIRQSIWNADVNTFSAGIEFRLK